MMLRFLKYWLPVLGAAVLGRKIWRNFQQVMADDFARMGNQEPVPNPLQVFIGDMACVFQRDPAARSWLEVATIYPGVQAVQIYRLSHWLWANGFKYSARLLSYLGRIWTSIEIHPGASIGLRFFIDHGMGTVIGETSVIGNDVSLYHQVTLGGTSWNAGKRHPTLKNNIVVGAGAKVLGPIVIHDGARVGANSVVIKDVPPGKTVVGVPGRTITDVKTETRLEVARSLGFDACGMQKSMPDPIANIINRILDHVHLMDQRQLKMCEVIHKLGKHLSPAELEALQIEMCYIKPLAEIGREEKDNNEEEIS